MDRKCVSFPNDSNILSHAQRIPSMDKPFATFPRFCVHDIDRNFVDDVEPARIRNATSQLGRLYLRTPNMLDARMV